MPNPSDRVRKKLLQERLERNLRQVEALEKQRDLTLDDGDKELLAERAEIIWQEIAVLEQKIAEFGVDVNDSLIVSAEEDQIHDRSFSELTEEWWVAALRERSPGDDSQAPVEIRQVSTPGVLRYILDLYFPKLHTWLTTRVRFLNLTLPPEWHILRDYLSTLHSRIADDISAKTYIEPRVKDLPEIASRFKAKRTGFLTPVQQLIKEIVGISQGGDAQSAQISAINKKSKFIRNIGKRLMSADEPLILLGDPGIGKSITLQQAAMLIAERESRRLFPNVCMFIRLGELRVSGEVDSKAVWQFIKRSAPRELQPFMDSLDALGRLVIFFDGMDEMSRERYNEYTTALSVFAGSRKGITKTIFSCRITDFTPRFQHNRLVLLPFDQAHTCRYLKKQIQFPITIGGVAWPTARALAKRLVQGDLPMQADNPFVLWLLCSYLQEEQDWPQSRVQLLEYYNRLNYDRKTRDATQKGESLPEKESVFLTWGRIAYAITERNKGAAIPLDEVRQILAPQGIPALEAGILCGVFQESMDLEQTLVRFEHHRFQEYFTALYLHQEQERLSAAGWLEKLDAPRWQETLFNLVLMKGGEEALNALNTAIRKGLARLKKLWKEKQRLEIAREETLLADRVELASRILQQTRQQTGEALPKLHTTFQKAAVWLADCGNPITKVKMLWAARIVQGVDIYRVAREALASNVSWLRQQALAITSAASGTVGVGALEEDLLQSFASGRFLNRLGGYFQVAAMLKQRKVWSALAIGSALCLLQLLAVYGLFMSAHRMVPSAISGLHRNACKFEQWMSRRNMSYAIQEGNQEELAKAKESGRKAALRAPRLDRYLITAQQSLDSWWFYLIANGAMLVSLLYMLRHAPGPHLLVTQGVGYFCLIFPFVWLPIWLGDWESVYVAVLTVAIPVAILLCVVYWVLTFLVQVLTLKLFMVGASHRTSLFGRNLVLLEVLWENCGFRISAQKVGDFIKQISIYLLAFVLLLGKWMIDWPLIVKFLGLFSALPPIMNVLLSVTVYLEGIGCVYSLLPVLKEERREWRKSSETFAIWTAVCSAFAVFILVGWGLPLVDWLTVYTFIVRGLFFSGLPPLANFFISVAIYIEAIGCLACFGRFGRKIFLSWTMVCLSLGILVFLIWGLVVTDWISIFLWLAEFALFPKLPLLLNVSLSLAIYFEALGCLVGLVSRIRRRETGRRDSVLWWRWTRTCLVATAVTFLGWGLYAISDYLSRLIAVALLLLLIALCLFFIRQLMRDVAPLLVGALRGPMGHATYSVKAWKQELAEVDSRSQATLLRRTISETLNLLPQDFLALLQEVQDRIQGEPALSAYWAKRYQIEQIIRQERVG